jgi:hypothetical protein
MASLLKISGLKAPKIPKIPIQKIELQPGTGTAIHHFKGAKTVKFHFASPDAMAAHVRKTLNNEWRNPEGNMSSKLERDLNI